MHMQSLLSKNDSNLNDYSAALHSSQMALFLVTWLQAPPLSPSHHIQLRACPPRPPHLLTVAVTETGQRWRERTMNGRILLEADDESSAVGDRFHCRRRHHSVEHAAADTRE